MGKQSTIPSADARLFTGSTYQWWWDGLGFLRWHFAHDFVSFSPIGNIKQVLESSFQGQHSWTVDFLLNSFMEWCFLRKKHLYRSLPRKESITMGISRVCTGYSRIPTGKEPWGNSPLSHLLMPGYLQEAHTSGGGLALGSSDGILPIFLSVLVRL